MFCIPSVSLTTRADSRRGAGKQATQALLCAVRCTKGSFLCKGGPNSRAREKGAGLRNLCGVKPRDEPFGPECRFSRRRPLRRCPDSTRGKGAGGQNRRARAFLMHWRRIRRRLCKNGAKDPSAFAEKRRESINTDSRVRVSSKILTGYWFVHVCLFLGANNFIQYAI